MNTMESSSNHGLEAKNDNNQPSSWQRYQCHRIQHTLIDIGGDYDIGGGLWLWLKTSFKCKKEYFGRLKQFFSWSQKRQQSTIVATTMLMSSDGAYTNWYCGRLSIWKMTLERWISSSRESLWELQWNRPLETNMTTTSHRWTKRYQCLRISHIGNATLGYFCIGRQL